jgi:hypothetical protein
LVLASDSRLTGGPIDGLAPKVFALPRSDALLAFAGDTQHAYPLVLQMVASIDV